MLNDELPTYAKVTTGDQLDQALVSAEMLLDRAEQTSERCRRMRIAEVGVVALAVFTLAIWAGFATSVSGVRLTIVLIISIAASLCAAGTIRFLGLVPLRKRLARDARSIVDAIGLIRELWPLVADHEKWNELQVQMFTARVSRFPVGPKGIR
jgi:hypothetical protein